MPREKLTPQNVRTLGAPGARTDYHDTVTKGLVLRVTVTGHRSYAAVFSWHGRKQRVSIGNVDRVTLADARSEARSIIAQRDLGDNPAEERRRARQGVLTVKALVEQCLEAIELQPGTADEYRRLAKVEVYKKLGTMRAAELPRQRVREWAARIARRAPYVANRAFGVLRRAYSWGLSQDLVETTPFAGLKAPGAERKSDRVLSTEEVRIVWLALAELEGQYADAVRLLFLTGVRREMVQGMCRHELEGLDGPEPRWVIPASAVGRNKSGVTHVVPLSTQAVAIVNRRLALADGPAVFPPTRPARSSSMWWSSRFVRELHAKAAELAEAPLPPWRIHEIRHTVATHMQEDLGVPNDVVSLILGHTPPAMAGADPIYLRALKLPARRAALVAWGAWLERVVAGERESARILPISR